MLAWSMASAQPRGQTIFAPEMDGRGKIAFRFISGSSPASPDAGSSRLGSFLAAEIPRRGSSRTQKMRDDHIEDFNCIRSNEIDFTNLDEPHTPANAPRMRAGLRDPRSPRIGTVYTVPLYDPMACASTAGRGRY